MGEIWGLRWLFNEEIFIHHKAPQYDLPDLRAKQRDDIFPWMGDRG